MKPESFLLIYDDAGKRAIPAWLRNALAEMVDPKTASVAVVYRTDPLNDSSILLTAAWMDAWGKAVTGEVRIPKSKAFPNSEKSS